MSNLSRLRTAMESAKIPAILLTDHLNIQWLTEFTGSAAQVIVTESQAIFVTDSRYTIQAQEQVLECEIITFGSPKSWDETVKDQLNRTNQKKFAFETNQSYSAVSQRKTNFSEFEWVETPASLMANLRMVKTEGEIDRIQAACKLADACIDHVSRLLQIGVAEFDINLEVEFFYRRNRAELAFDPIVVSGPNSAKPHGRAGERKLQNGDFLTIDCGARLNGYCSDITRTFVIGEASSRHAEIYNQVLRAEVECCQLLKPGASGKEVDQHARDVLGEIDLDKYFGHGLGHGLGLNVHDPGGLSKSSEVILEPGMVFTVEPGVYIEGFGGVRIEDDVLITENEPRILTSYPKELTIIG